MCPRWDIPPVRKGAGVAATAGAEQSYAVISQSGTNVASLQSGAPAGGRRSMMMKGVPELQMLCVVWKSRCCWENTERALPNVSRAAYSWGSEVNDDDRCP
ncbi:hypothetical protein J4Q44_G00154480 [Coregonus suidteri]|uniref:Uncharacterized protein n=1 Tax=Coregonus suidteri TaxID=861788 RepID=A0AAN8LQ59_9TELE